MPDTQRITARLQALWTIALGTGGGAQRLAFSSQEAEAMMLVAGWAREAGLEPGIDAHGNLWAMPAGWEGPVVTAGSHVDTVPDGGRYDGALGTILGLELAHDLAAPTAGGARAGLLVCAAEEAPRFAAGTIGSRLLAGTLDRGALTAMHDADGVSAAEAQGAYLRALEALPRIEAPTGRLVAHAEIHVAQRRSLRELGVVTRVASPRRFEIVITGEAGHSGEVSMEARRDALTAAAQVILAVEQIARAEPAETVATVGMIAVSPGSVSVIPAVARLGVDVRAIAGDSLARVQEALEGRTREIARSRGVASEVRLVRAGEPVSLDARLAVAALHAASELGIPVASTWSGAGHDAQHLAAIAPTLLLFVPLHGGESHTPREGAEMGEIVDAAKVAAVVLDRCPLDSGPHV